MAVKNLSNLNKTLYISILVVLILLTFFVLLKKYKQGDTNDQSSQLQSESTASVSENYRNTTLGISLSVSKNWKQSDYGDLVYFHITNTKFLYVKKLENFTDYYKSLNEFLGMNTENSGSNLYEDHSSRVISSEEKVIVGKTYVIRKELSIDGGYGMIAYTLQNKNLYQIGIRSSSETTDLDKKFLEELLLSVSFF